MRRVSLIVVMLWVLVCNCFAEELVQEYVEGTVKEAVPAVESPDQFQELATLFKVDPNIKQPKVTEMVEYRHLTIFPKGSKIKVYDEDTGNGLCYASYGRDKQWCTPCKFLEYKGLKPFEPEKETIEELRKGRYAGKGLSDAEILRREKELDNEVKAQEREEREAVDFISKNRERIVQATLKAHPVLAEALKQGKPGLPAVTDDTFKQKPIYTGRVSYGCTLYPSNKDALNKTKGIPMPHGTLLPVLGHYEMEGKNITQVMYDNRIYITTDRLEKQ